MDIPCTFSAAGMATTLCRPGDGLKRFEANLCFDLTRGAFRVQHLVQHVDFAFWPRKKDCSAVKNSVNCIGLEEELWASCVEGNRWI